MNKNQPTVNAAAYLLLSLWLLLVTVIVQLDLMEIRFPIPGQAQQFSWVFYVVLTALGTVAAWLVCRIRLSSVLPGEPAARALGMPFVIGALFGAVLVMLDLLLDFSGLAATAAGVPSIQVPFPESLLIYPAGAIVVETMYRLVPLAVAVWLVSHLILRGRFQPQTFWAIAVLLALLEPLTQSALFAADTTALVVYVVYAFAFNLVQMWVFRRYGFFASLSQRLGNYLVWHILWGLA